MLMLKWLWPLEGPLWVKFLSSWAPCSRRASEASSLHRGGRRLNLTEYNFAHSGLLFDDQINNGEGKWKKHMARCSASEEMTALPPSQLSVMTPDEGVSVLLIADVV